MTKAADDGQPASPSPVRAFAAILRGRRRQLLGTFAAVLGLAAAAYALTPRRFAAAAEVALDQRTAPGAASRNTELRILAANDIVGAAVDRLGLARRIGFGRSDEAAPADRARAIQTIRSGLRIEPHGGAAWVRYTGTDPELAAAIANGIADQYVDYRRNGGARGRENALLRADAAAAQQELIRAQAALAGYRSATSLIGDGERRDLIQQELSALNVQLEAARAEQRAAEQRFGPGNGITSPRLRELRAEQARLAVARAAALSRGDQDSEVATIDHQLAETARDATAEARRLYGLGGAVQAARQRTASATAARDRVATRLRAVDRAAAQLAARERDVRTAEQRYAAAAERFRRSSAAMRGPGSAFVIAHAAVPGRPSSPDPFLFAGLGLLAALVAALAAALLPEFLARGFRTRQQAERKLGIPVIGMVPDLGKIPAARAALADPSAPVDYLLAHSRSAFGNAFRSIHAGLRLGGGAHSPRCVAVSSALPEEGKTTVSVCLARSAALAGLRVVLVDCDVRRPAATQYLTAHVDTGLIEVLEGLVPLKDALLRDTPSGAWLLAISSNGLAGNDQVGSPTMAALVKELSRSYDLVVLDTPPALALAEARSVAAFADCVILVARWRTTPTQATRIALDQLQQAKAKVTAAVLTLVAP